MTKPSAGPTPLKVSVEDMLSARARWDGRERAALHRLRRMRRVA